jgi:hypothetical protein
MCNKVKGNDQYVHMQSAGALTMVDKQRRG